MWSFMMHIVISSIIFGIMGLGFKFFLKLRSTLDFSYIGIIIFASYTAALCNIHLGWWFLASTGVAILLSLLFTGFVLYLSHMLSGIYFDIGALSFYMLCFQLAYNLKSITWGALGLSWISRNLVASMNISSLEGFLVLTIIIILIFLLILMWFKRSYFFTILRAWGEHDLVVKSLGVPIVWYKFTMIGITTILAAVWGSLFAFYYLYIDPPSFWLYLLMMVIIICFISYDMNDWWTMLVALWMVFLYEYLRFFKFVDPSKIGYVREIIISLLQIAAAFWVFRRIRFGRRN